MIVHKRSFRVIEALVPLRSWVIRCSYRGGMHEDAARRKYEMDIDTQAYLGDQMDGILGLLNQPEAATITGSAQVFIGRAQSSHLDRILIASKLYGELVNADVVNKRQPCYPCPFLGYEGTPSMVAYRDEDVEIEVSTLVYDEDRPFLVGGIGAIKCNPKRLFYWRPA